MTELRYVNDDWEELWIGGEIAVAGHSLSSWQILYALCECGVVDGLKMEQAYRCIYCDEDLGEKWEGRDFICLDCKERK